MERIRNIKPMRSDIQELSLNFISLCNCRTHVLNGPGNNKELLGATEGGAQKRSEG